MRKIISYIAISLDGKIARPGGEVDWLDKVPHPEGEDYGYADFYASVDTTLMGFKTYSEVLSFDVPFPYPDKTNYVLTRTPGKPPAEHVEFISGDIGSFLANLKKQDGKNIWLVGGAQLNTVLWNLGLLDEMMVFIMPWVLGDGISLFADHPQESPLELISTKSWSSGVQLLHYRRSEPEG